MLRSWVKILNLHLCADGLLYFRNGLRFQNRVAIFQNVEATLRHADLSFETSDLSESDSKITFRNGGAVLIDQNSPSKYHSRLSQFNFSLFGFCFRVSKVAANLPEEPGGSRLVCRRIQFLQCVKVLRCGVVVRGIRPIARGSSQLRVRWRFLRSFARTRPPDDAMGESRGSITAVRVRTIELKKPVIRP